MPRASKFKPPDDYYTISEAAIYLRVNERTIRNWIKRGHFRRIGPFRPYRLAAEDVEKLTQVST